MKRNFNIFFAISLLFAFIALIFYLRSSRNVTQEFEKFNLEKSFFAITNRRVLINESCNILQNLVPTPDHRYEPSLEKLDWLELLINVSGKKDEKLKQLLILCKDKSAYVNTSLALLPAIIQAELNNKKIDIDKIVKKLPSLRSILTKPLRSRTGIILHFSIARALKEGFIDDSELTKNLITSYKVNPDSKDKIIELADKITAKARERSNDYRFRKEKAPGQYLCWDLFSMPTNSEKELEVKFKLLENLEESFSSRERVFAYTLDVLPCLHSLVHDFPTQDKALKKRIEKTLSRTLGMYILPVWDAYPTKKCRGSGWILQYQKQNTYRRCHHNTFQIEENSWITALFKNFPENTLASAPKIFLGRLKKSIFENYIVTKNVNFEEASIVSKTNGKKVKNNLNFIELMQIENN